MITFRSHTWSNSPNYKLEKLQLVVTNLVSGSNDIDQGIRAHLFCQGIYRDSQVIDLNGSMGLYRDYLILYQRQVFKVIDLNGL